MKALHTFVVVSLDIFKNYICHLNLVRLQNDESLTFFWGKTRERVTLLFNIHR